MKTGYLSLLLGASLLLNVLLITECPFALENLSNLGERDNATASNTASSTDVTESSYPFIRVVDGDTVIVGTPNGSEYVRLIGINAPEPNDPGGPECYATEATEHLKELTNSAGTVTLVFDESQGVRDRYNRLLAYVLLSDGTDLNEQMLRDGYVHEYTYNAKYVRYETYKSAEADALAAERGLWAAQACR